MIKKHDKRLEAFKSMPPLANTVGGEYDPNTSEVLEWIRNQPELLNFIFDQAKYKRLIEYHDGAWIGVDNIKGGEQDG